MAKWFYELEGEPIGPIDEAVMRQWSDEGKLKREQRVRKEDEESWRLVVNCPELASRRIEEMAEARPGAGGIGGHPFATDGSLPMARIAQKECAVLSDPDAKAMRIGTLRADDLVELRRVWRWSDEWIEIYFASDRKGYIAAATPVILIPRAMTQESDVVACMDPDSTDEPIVTLPVGTRFWIVGVSHLEAESHVHVRLDSGRTGRIAGSTRIRTLPQVEVERVNTGRRDIKVGGLWMVGGTAVTIVTYMAADGGGTYMVCWGAILFGAIQFLRGLYYSLTCGKPPTYDLWPVA